MSNAPMSIYEMSMAVVEACRTIHEHPEIFSQRALSLASETMHVIHTRSAQGFPSALPDLNLQINTLLSDISYSRANTLEDESIIESVKRTLTDALRYVFEDSIESEISYNVHEVSAFRKIVEQQNNELTRKIGELQTKLNLVEQEFSDRKDAIETAAKDATHEIARLLNNFQSTASESSNTLIYKNYKDSATIEQSLSNKFRNYSVAMMLTATLIATYTILSPTSSLSLGETIFRLVVSILLSIPAAYFARESAKHRAQQYLYQQYHLTLDALPAFIAELETESKSKLKAEVAKVLFTSANQGSSITDPYPINIAELLEKLLDKIPSRP